MKNLMRRWTRTALVALCLLGLAVPTASAESLSVRLLDADLAKLPFGKDKKAAAEWVKDRLNNHYGPQIKRALDAGERQRIRAGIDKEIAEILKAVVVFKGQRTGLETSVIAEEFEHGAGEELMTARVGSEVHYLFFSEGQLFKYVRTLDGKVSFVDRVKLMGRDFGAPTRLQGGNDAAATWMGDKVEMKVRDARRVFGVDILIVQDRKLAAKVEDRRAKARKSGRKASGLENDELADILDDGSESEEALRDDMDKPQQLPEHLRKAAEKKKQLEKRRKKGHK